MKRANRSTGKNIDELISKLSPLEILDNKSMMYIKGGGDDGNGSEPIIIPPPPPPQP